MIQRSIPLDLSQACWSWPNATRFGYGRVTVGGRRVLAHRRAHELFIGPVPLGHDVEHACHSAAVSRGECAGGGACTHRRCWNPAHLEAVTRRENLLRGAHPSVVAHRTNTCKRGHSLADALRNGKWRRCRTCAKESCRRYYQAEKRRLGRTPWSRGRSRKGTEDAKRATT